MTSFWPYVPQAADLADLGIVWLIAALFMLGGGLLIGRRHTPELRLVAGWGALCVLLTLWGVATSLSLGWPAFGFVIIALVALLRAGSRPSRRDLIEMGRLLVLTLPLWLIFAPIRPSQPDTFLNLLPNAAYLVAHDYLPADTRIDAHSFIAGAPYNSQFAAYLGGLLRQDFPGGGMSLFNLVLQLAAGLTLARCLARTLPEEPKASEGARDGLGWGVIAGGFLLAIPLNPGFVPRISLAPYGEPALAVTKLFAGVILITRPVRGTALALGLVLAAMINTKQSGIGLVAALAAAALVLALADRWVARRAEVTNETDERRLQTLLLGFILPVLLYGAWRLYVTGHFAVGELKPLPFSAWQWANLPKILASIFHIIITKPFFFVPTLGVSAFGIVQIWRGRQILAARASLFFAALFLAYSAFLLLTYIAHFPGEMSVEAHSYFRYNTHLSLLLMAVLVLLLAPWFRARLSNQHLHALGVVAILMTLVTPLAFAKRLRFDLDQPQPIVWDLTKQLAGYLAPDEAVALLLPGDNGSVGPMMESVLRDTAPFKRDLDLTLSDKADPAALSAARESGHRTVFISCTDGATLGAAVPLPAHSAVLLRADGENWRIVATWPYKPIDRHQRWQHILAWEPLCRS